MICAIIGDSIAAGVSMQQRECVSRAQVGITSQQFSRQNIQIQADSVLISLGSNDGNSDFSSYMENIRSRIDSKNVVWLISSNNRRAGDAAERIAEANGDRIIHVVGFVGRDRVHPNLAGYREIARIWQHG